MTSTSDPAASPSALPKASLLGSEPLIEESAIFGTSAGKSISIQPHLVILQLKVPEAFVSKSIRRRLAARPLAQSACAAPSVAWQRHSVSVQKGML